MGTNTAMSDFDSQERAILRALIRNPRVSDNRIATTTGVPVRTVRRKRSRLENQGRVRYYAAIDRERSQDAATVTTQHMVIIKFRLGVTREQIEEEIRNEPNVANVFSELIRDSYLAETDGHIALVMIVEGASDSDVADSLQGKILPSIQNNHGKDCILEMRTMRVLGLIRREHNYLPRVNMPDAILAADWPDEAIYLG
jgi:DNA-binding Lrp family transcriptional regulator